jgi:hypothetical protein
MISQEQVQKEDSHWKAKKKVEKNQVSMVGGGDDVSTILEEEIIFNEEYAEETLQERTANMLLYANPRRAAERERLKYCRNCRKNGHEQINCREAKKCRHCKVEISDNHTEMTCPKKNCCYYTVETQGTEGRIADQ